jgi:hypothetical protein
MAETLTVAPRQGFKSFLDVPLALDLDNLDAHVAILGIPYGDPYSIDEVTNDQTNAPTAVRQASDAISGGPCGRPPTQSAAAQINGTSTWAARSSTAVP